MDPLTYSWLSNCALEPFVGALCVWILFMFNVYRHDWRNLDLFLVVIVLQELLSSLIVFAYSIINLIRAKSETACNIVMWGLIAFRIFQMATICSLAIDRALIIKWPYKYRFSVRQNQILYHIVVLGLMSGLVGIAGIFARLSTNEISLKLASNTSFIRTSYCTLNPTLWNIRFNIFFTSIAAFLTLLTLISFIYIELNRNNDQQLKSKIMPKFRIPSYGDLAMETCGSTETITKYNTGSCQSLQGFQKLNKEILNNQKVLLNHLQLPDLRWSVVVSTTSLSYAINQGPFLLFMFVGILLPHFWTPLHDNVLTWFMLAEGLFLPFCFYLTHENFRDAIKVSLKRPNRDKYSSSPGSIKKPPFFLNYNDFVMIDKPYLGLFRKDSKINTSTLNLVSNFRRNQEMLQKNDFKIINGFESSTNHPKSNYVPYNRNHFLTRSNNQFGYVFASHVNHVPHAYDLKNNTLRSNLAKSVDSIKKEKITSIPKDSMQLNNWHFMTAEKKCVDKHVDGRKEVEEEHIYDTLKIEPSSNNQVHTSKYFHNLIKFKSKTDKNKAILNVNQTGQVTNNNLDNKSVSGLSFTTNANDDFEFHNIRNSANIKCEKNSHKNNFEEESSSSDDSPLISIKSSSANETYNCDFLSSLFDNSTLMVNKFVSDKPGVNNHDLQAKINAKKVKSDDHKRRGLQFFSTRDLRLLDSQSPESLYSKVEPIVSYLKTKNLNKSKFSSDQKSKSETNLATISNPMSLERHLPNHFVRHNKNEVSKSFNHPYSHHLHQSHNHLYHIQQMKPLDNQSVVSVSSRSTNKSSFHNQVQNSFLSKIKVERISSFSKHQPKVKASRYQMHKKIRKQEHVLDIDYRKHAPGSRFSLPSEPSGKDFPGLEIIGSMPDLSLNSLPMYTPNI